MSIPVKIPRRALDNAKVTIPPTVKNSRKKKGITEGIVKVLISSVELGSKVFTKRISPKSDRRAISKWGMNFFRNFMKPEYQKWT